MSYETGKGLLVFKAYANYREITGSASNMNTRLRFQKFLGDEIAYSTWSDMIAELTEDAFVRVRWMAGPNYKFLYKVWEARQVDNVR